MDLCGRLVGVGEFRGFVGWVLDFGVGFVWGIVLIFFGVFFCIVLVVFIIGCSNLVFVLVFFMVGLGWGWGGVVLELGIFFRVWKLWG